MKFSMQAKLRRVLTPLAVGTRRGLTWDCCLGKAGFLKIRKDLHLGKRGRLWTPSHMSIGDHVFVGMDVHIKCNAKIGDYYPIAEHVALVRQKDHDFKAVCFLVRFTPWIGISRFPIAQSDQAPCSSGRLSSSLSHTMAHWAARKEASFTS